NNIWETAGPNIISTLIHLDESITPTIISNVVSLRTRMGEYFIPKAIKADHLASSLLLKDLELLQNTAQAYAEFDYKLYREFTFIANKPVYGLI
ncbi:fatty acid metabolism transcriptional regulator FadR, partial [Glaesserella parasuis]|nr:fatty acid metabolism transcriptional regulator FadR [Glaesserella parasuis]